MRLLFSIVLVAGVCFTKVSATGNNPLEKILTVSVNEKGVIAVGSDTVAIDVLAHYLQDRLFKSYLGTGNMQNRIKFSPENNTVSEKIIQSVIQEIREGQKRALTELCLQKYETQFENIDSRKQAKLKKRFPVLFQTDYQ